MLLHSCVAQIEQISMHCTSQSLVYMSSKISIVAIGAFIISAATMAAAVPGNNAMAHHKNNHKIHKYRQYTHDCNSSSRQ